MVMRLYDKSADGFTLAANQEASKKCPRTRCRQVISSAELCCVGCFKLIPKTILSDLGSKAVHARPALLDDAKAAAVAYLKKLSTPRHLLPSDD